MKLHALFCLLFVSNLLLISRSQILAKKVVENDSFKKDLESLILQSILLEDSKADNESSEESISKSELKRLLLKRNHKMNQLKQLSVLNG